MKCGIADVGSNTIRLSIYRWEGTQFKLLLNKKVMAGLAGYIKDGALSDSGILVACRTLAGFRALLDNFGLHDLYVFGHRLSAQHCQHRGRCADHTGGDRPDRGGPLRARTRPRFPSRAPPREAALLPAC